MRVERMGERALILRDLPLDPALAARRLMEAGVGEEAVASYETVGIYYSDAILELGGAVSVIEEALTSSSDVGAEMRSHTIPVCYEMGEDLEEAALTLGIPVTSLVESHSGTVYKCFAVGFCPGFAYLGYLPDSIGRLPRLASPRKRIEPGSVAITGRQTAVYPLPTPGGWHLIGRTPLILVDEADNYFPIQAGDSVQFACIDRGEFERLRGERL